MRADRRVATGIVGLAMLATAGTLTMVSAGTGVLAFRTSDQLPHDLGGSAPRATWNAGPIVVRGYTAAANDEAGRPVRVVPAPTQTVTSTAGAPVEAAGGFGYGRTKAKAGGPAGHSAVTAGGTTTGPKQSTKPGKKAQQSSAKQQRKAGKATKAARTSSGAKSSKAAKQAGKAPKRAGKAGKAAHKAGKGKHGAGHGSWRWR